MMPRRYVLAAFPQIMTDCSDFGERTCRCEVWDYDAVAQRERRMMVECSACGGRLGHTGAIETMPGLIQYG